MGVYSDQAGGHPETPTIVKGIFMDNFAVVCGGAFTVFTLPLHPLPCPLGIPGTGCNF